MDAFERFYAVNSDFRDPYSRDRDRIIHSSSFRRLEYKTQVFLNSVGDFFRTRLTHSLEVSQIARAIAKELGLSESLCEAIALAHDLGHTPFGHVGGDELDLRLRESGFSSGFEHNYQSFRVVTELEKRYLGFDGLNLTFATLEGILKHSEPYHKPFFSKKLDEIFLLDFHPSIEAMIVDYSDEIAYISHDIDDGLKCGYLKVSQIRENALIESILHRLQKEGIDEENEIFYSRLVSMLINDLILNFIQHSMMSRAFKEKSENPQCCKYPASENIGIGFDKQTATEVKKLKKILYDKLYYHAEVKKKMFFGKQCITKLFEAFLSDIRLLPECLQKQIKNGKQHHRVVADYIASMSDRFAIQLYRELYVG
ncbi:deoxyguanosinetriphosphate triphosphohydrolase [Helicobacter monodelphidis]|uniref:deoxyguanosinetriphosphate triphosphohydrolase family protein n=1 Tax=Helicobacter sp. 15-1451 TaxID=2004995 RepID=UPI000DCC9D72|nr:dNTP triphosphohydrolase [Helicobacter sp. 15-1451]RAX56626.1 deoxyguanosinetriphosphate triphosphohydrolase [Helicobacter sp. 15-1451]